MVLIDRTVARVGLRNEEEKKSEMVSLGRKRLGCGISQKPKWFEWRQRENARSKAEPKICV